MGPKNLDYSILFSIFGSLIFGKLRLGDNYEVPFFRPGPYIYGIVGSLGRVKTEALE